MTNGATCTIKKITTSGDNKARGVIWVEFADELIGKKTRQDNQHLYRQACVNKRYTPIIPVSRKFNVGRTQEVTRIQFPLRPSSAKTCHRAQGSTESKLVVDFTGRTQVHIHYVAFSLVKTLDKLHILHFDPGKIKVSQEVIKEMERLRNNNCAFSCPFLFNVEADLKVMFLNCPSLHRHLKDVNSDFSMQDADVLICAETRFLSSDSNDQCSLSNFICHRNDDTKSTRTRPSHGMALYYKDGILLQEDVHNANSNRIEITVAKAKSVNIIGVYKPPDVSKGGGSKLFIYMLNI